MDDKFKKLGFKDFITVDYTGTGDEFLAYQAQKRRRGHYDTWGDDYTPEEGEQLDETIDEVDEGVVSLMGRLKRALNARKNKRKMAMGRERAKRRAASPQVIRKRARKQATMQWMLKRTKGIHPSKLAPQRRAQLEKEKEKPGAQNKINRIATKLRPEVRKQDRERRAGAKKKDK